MSEILKCTALCRSFGKRKALDSVTLTIESGKIAGLLGPNGAGKTTLIKLANGLLQPDSGEITICGMHPGLETKKIVSYLPDCMFFADWMKVGDIIGLFRDFYADFDPEKSREMCRMLGLNDSQRIKTLSKGTREKMQIMLVMSRKAKLYLLDEPIGGVDPAAREFILKTIISNYNEEGAVILSTHLIQDVEQVLDEAVFIQNGRIVLHENVDDIRETYGTGVDALFREKFRAENRTGGETE